MEGLALTHQLGSKSIDGIFISSSLSIIKIGYMPFSTIPSIHRAIWCQIKINLVFGHIPQPIAPFLSRRVKCNNPAVVD